MKTILLLCIIILVSAAVQNMIGFGYSALSVSFMTMIFPYTEAIALMQCIGIVSTGYVALKHVKSIRWKVLLPILIPTLVIGSAFTLLSVRANGNWIHVLMGLMFVFLAVFFFLFSGKVHVKPSLRNGAIMGALCGIGSGLFGVAGPPAAIYMLDATESKQEYIGGMNMIFFGMNVFSVVLRIIAGTLPMSDLPLIGIGWAAILVGTILGLRILKLINIEHFRKLVYIFVGLNGLYIVLTHL